VFKIRRIGNKFGLWQKLTSRYNQVYIDIDYKNKFFTRLRDTIDKFKLKETYVYSTNKGFHCYVYLDKKISYFRVIKILKYIGSDKEFIDRFRRTGTQALFSVRRGKPNEKYVGLYYQSNAIYCNSINDEYTIIQIQNNKKKR